MLERIALPASGDAILLETQECSPCWALVRMSTPAVLPATAAAPSPAAMAPPRLTPAAPAACGPAPRGGPGPGRQTCCPAPRTGPPAGGQGPAGEKHLKGVRTSGWTTSVRRARQPEPRVPHGLLPSSTLRPPWQQAHKEVGVAPPQKPAPDQPPSLTGASSYAASAAPSTPAAAAARSTRGPPVSRLRSYSCRARGLLSTCKQGTRTRSWAAQLARQAYPSGARSEGLRGPGIVMISPDCCARSTRHLHVGETSVAQTQRQERQASASWRTEAKERGQVGRGSGRQGVWHRLAPVPHLVGSQQAHEGRAVGIPGLRSGVRVKLLGPLQPGNRHMQTVERDSHENFAYARVGRPAAKHARSTHMLNTWAQISATWRAERPYLGPLPLPPLSCPPCGMLLSALRRLRSVPPQAQRTGTRHGWCPQQQQRRSWQSRIGGTSQRRRRRRQPHRCA